jgi:hypothetical protein
MVRVWNKNTLPYEENFKGQDIKIPANSYIEMNPHEAVEFKSNMGRQPVFLKGGVPDPAGFKKIVIEEIDDTIEEDEKKN